MHALQDRIRSQPLTIRLVLCPSATAKARLARSRIASVADTSQRCGEA